MAPRYVSPLIVEPGSVFGFATTPLFPSSPPTGRYGALVVLGHNADLVVIGVLDGVWTSLPTLAEVTGRKLMRHSRFESGKKPVAFGFDRKWTVELQQLTLLGLLPLDDEQQRIANRYLGDNFIGRVYSLPETADSEVEGEWRWVNDREAYLAESAAEQERREREYAAAQERYETRLKDLTWEHLLAETPFERWNESPPFPSAEFRDAAAERVRETYRELQALGPKPRKADVRKAVKSLLQWIKDADAAAGLVLETEERDDIYLLLEEITHVARQPSLLPEMEPWHTW